MYYRGDYYRGDYYRGDVFGFLKKAVGAVGRALIPAPIQAVARGITGLIGGGSNVPVPYRPPSPIFPAPPGFQLPQFGQGGLQQYTGPMGPGMAMMACPTKGQRLNKATYITRGGGTSRWPMQLLVHPKGTECVKTRRMNVANPRALRRAIRRNRGFIKLARKAARAVGLTVVRSGRGRKKK